MDDSDHAEEEPQTKSSGNKLFKIFIILTIIFVLGGIGAAIAAIVNQLLHRYKQIILPLPMKKQRTYKRKSKKSTKIKISYSSIRNLTSPILD